MNIAAHVAAAGLDQNDVSDIKIGDYYCRKKYYDKDPEEVASDENLREPLLGGVSIDIIECEVRNSEAGLYTPTMNIGGNYGMAEYNEGILRSDVNGNTYMFKVIPKIEDIYVPYQISSGGG